MSSKNREKLTAQSGSKQVIHDTAMEDKKEEQWTVQAKFGLKLDNRGGYKSVDMMANDKCLPVMLQE